MEEYKRTGAECIYILIILIGLICLIVLIIGKAELTDNNTVESVSDKIKSYAKENGLLPYTSMVVCDLDCKDKGFTSSTGLWNSWNGYTTCLCNNGSKQITLWKKPDTTTFLGLRERITNSQKKSIIKTIIVD